MPSPFPQHSGESRNNSRYFARRDVLGWCCQSALGGCESGRVPKVSGGRNSSSQIYRITEYPEVEGTTRIMEVQLLALHKMTPKMTQQQRGHSREDAAFIFGSIFSLSLSIPRSGSPLHTAESTHKKGSGWGAPGGCFYPTFRCCQQAGRPD